MGINWDNVDRLRTLDGYPVLGSHMVDNDAATYRLVYRSVSVRRLDGSVLEVRVNCETGEVPNRNCKHLDIIELPPEPPKPREVVRVMNRDVFEGADGCGAWKNLFMENNQMVRVRIIEEPEDKPCD
jgi:hypothetical protein